MEIHTYGCTFNKALSRSIENKVKNNEFFKDKVIFNGCSVKERTEKRMLHKIEELAKKHGKNLIVFGCVAAINEKKIIPLAEKYGFQYFKNYDEFCDHFHLDKQFFTGSFDFQDTLILPIATGCLNNCSYCATKFAKGKLRSFSEKEILDQIKKSKSHEIYLTSQDNGAYGLDVGSNIVDLLKKIKNIAQQKIIRIGMMNPQYFLAFKEELIELLKDPHYYSFLHLPIQSGSQKVLDDMKRHYKIGDVVDSIKEIRKQIPDLCIETDIICGFPTEKEEDFEETKKILKEVEFDYVNVSKFSRRPGIEANKYKPLPTEEVKKRSTEISALWKEIALKRNKKFLNKTYFAHIQSSFPMGGRTKNYKQIYLRKNIEDWKAEEPFYLVKLIEATPTYFIADPIRPARLE